MKVVTPGLLGRKMSSDAFDTRLGQVVCFVASAVALVVSLWKVMHFDLRGAQLFFGVLLSFCVPLLLVSAGLLLPGAVAARQTSRTE